MTKQNKILISGPGRSGTTFLVQLFSQLGENTSFEPGHRINYDARSNAGLEWDVFAPQSPYIVKNPNICDTLESIIQSDRYIIDHIFIGMRELEKAAQSRALVERRHPHWRRAINMVRLGGGVPGGLWGTKRPAQQPRLLAEKTYKLFYVAALHDIPFSVVTFPRLVVDPDYCYATLSAVRGYGYKEFLDAYKAVARPELVHIA